MRYQLLNCTVQDCDDIPLNRFFQEYEHCLDMCRFFLSDQYLNRQNDQQRHFCFLVPMDMVYEDFITAVVKTELGQHFKHIRPQSTAWLTDEEVFQIRNDLLLTTHEGNILVVDTKYKVRKYESADGKGGISQTDLYQMVSYALRRNTRQVVSLYPQPFRPETIELPPTSSHSFTVSSGLLDKGVIHIKAMDLVVTGQVSTQKEFNQIVVKGHLLDQLTNVFKSVEYP